MRLASIITLLLLWYSSAPAQTLKYTPIPPAAAEVIAALPNAKDLDSIRQNYVAAPLQLREGVEAILVEGRGIGPCGANNCQAYNAPRRSETRIEERTPSVAKKWFDQHSSKTPPASLRKEKLQSGSNR